MLVAVGLCDVLCNVLCGLCAILARSSNLRTEADALYNARLAEFTRQELARFAHPLIMR